MSIAVVEQIGAARRGPRRHHGNGAAATTTARTSVSATKRYNEFRPEQNPYLRLLREGIELSESPDVVRDQLTEAHLYHFVCPDPSIVRENGSIIPKFVGVLRVVSSSGSCTYVHPLNDDLAQMYAERTDISRAWEILQDETPYWVDRYALRVAKRK
jgi:hypothetical protein